MGITRHTPEVIDAVLAAWRAGAGYVEIGKNFNLSTGMVAGIVERNKEPGEKHVPPLRSPPAPRVECLPRAIKRPVRTGHGARFAACQWIAGEPSADDRCKCCAATGASRVYCRKHEARVWRSAPAEAGL